MDEVSETDSSDSEEEYDEKVDGEGEADDLDAARETVPAVGA